MSQHEEKQWALVAGGAGFLGYHLCSRLLKDSFKVIVVDSLLTGQADNVNALQHADNGAGNVKFIKLDITKPIPEEDLKNSDGSPIQLSFIYNLACAASPKLYQLDPIHTMETCFLGVQNLLKLAKKHGARILQASTSEVYGDPKENPQKETYRGHVNPIGPRACYDEGKRIAETLMFEYAKEEQVDIRVIRIFNTYGPRMRPDDGRVVSNFLIRAILNEPIELYGDGSQTRSFQYVDDLIEGMIRMMHRNKEEKGPVNIGNPHEFTIKQLADMVLKKVKGCTSEIRILDAVEDDPLQRRPDISKAKEKLEGWEPKIQLEQGLEATLEYFQSIDLTKYKQK